MKLHSLLLLLVLTVVAAFSVLNWSAFLSPTELSLGFASVQLPLGLIMLGMLIVVTTLFLAFLVYLQGSVLLEARRHAKELRTNRELADRAEASRFSELRAFIEAELTKHAGGKGDASDALLARIDQLEHALKSSLEQSSNTLAAYIGELEDRLEKALPPATAG